MNLEISQVEEANVEKTEALIAQCYKDKCMTFPNGVCYTMAQVSKKEGLKVVGLWRQVQAGASIGSDVWNSLEAALSSLFMINGLQVSKIHDHFEGENMGNYFTFINYAAAMVTYPFKLGSRTD